MRQSEMIDIGTFEEVRRRFGHFASWAVWAGAGNKPKDNIADLRVLDPKVNSRLLQTLNAQFIFLGLNISRPLDRPFGNFHDARPMATDFKIRYALKGTCYWGSYMTDIIKDFEEKASGRVVNFLRTNRDFERENIEQLREEISVLGFTAPVLVAFGRDAERIAERNLGNEYHVAGIPHYANYVSKEDYRKQVHEKLLRTPK